MMDTTTTAENKITLKDVPMMNIPLGDIIEGERRRLDYGELKLLKDSIREHGLIHPIAVSYEPDQEGKYRLIAGGRRYRSHVELGLPSIPARIFPRVLSDLEVRTLELEENIQRLDMTWEERIRLQKEIHDTRIALHGRKISPTVDAPGHTIADTANILNKGAGTLAQDLRLAQAMEEFPDFDWKSCKNKSEAYKLMRSMERLLEANVGSADFLSSIGTTQEEDELFIKKRLLSDAYILGDCLLGIPSLEDSKYHLVEIDPPYAIDLKKNKKTSNENTFDYTERDSSDYLEFLREVLKNVIPKMAPNSWLILWFAQDPWYSSVLSLLQEFEELQVEPLPAVWTKTSGQNNRPMDQLTSAYEMFFYARKGNIQLRKPGRVNVFSQKPVPAHKKIHPTERPMELVRELIRVFGTPGGHLLVPFAGSGKTLKAAVEESMTPIGYDLGQAYYNAFQASLQDDEDFGMGEGESDEESI